MHAANYLPWCRSCEPPWPAKRGRSKALFLAVLNGTSIPDSEPVSCSCDPDNWAYGRSTFETSAKEIISVRISFCPRAASFEWPPRCVAHAFCNPESPVAFGHDSSFFAVTQQHWRACVRRMLRCRLACILPPFSLGPVAFGHDSSFFAVTQQQWRACVRRMLRCRLACILPPSSLGPRLNSGAVAVAEDEDRDKFIGDRGPLDSREKSLGHSHLPHYPRLCRMIFGRTETVQITSRAAKDCSYLYEIPRSRVAKHVIGPRFSQSWLDHLSDESLVVVNIAVESCVSEDLLKTCASVEIVSELYYCQTRMTALVMVEPFNRALDIGKNILVQNEHILHKVGTP